MVVDPDASAVQVGVPEAVGTQGFVRVALQPLRRGRGRVVVTYADLTWQSIHFYVVEPLPALIAAYGDFATHTMWLPRNFTDPFGRGASIMPWDREDGVHVLQDARPFVVGLSDDAGGGGALGYSTKVGNMAAAEQVRRLDDYITFTLMGTKPEQMAPQFSLQDPATDRILMTLFYFDRPKLNETPYYQETDKCQIYPSWCAFNAPWCNPLYCSFEGHAAAGAGTVAATAASPPSKYPDPWIAEYRQFNSPHQISVYYNLYLIARNHDRIPTVRTWDWYLQRAVDTLFAMACFDNATHTFRCAPSVGLMDGTVFRSVLLAARDEGWTSTVALIETLMRMRTLTGVAPGQQAWVDADFPYGSEFSWDTTGQEEVAVWGAYFNASSAGLGELEDRVCNAILAYDPLVPHWVYAGAAFGMGDFSNNAKWLVLGGWEREGGHYRAGLNAIPLLERYRRHPGDVHLLRVGLAGVMNVIPNIDSAGAPSMGFHTSPFVLQHDPNSGDHGLGFFGHSQNVGAYLVDDAATLATFGAPQCFLCDLHAATAEVGAAVPLVITARDTYHRRLFVASLGLHVHLRNGAWLNATLDYARQTLLVTVAPAAANADGVRQYSVLRVAVEGTLAAAPLSLRVLAPPGVVYERGAFSIPPPSSDLAAGSFQLSWAPAV